MIEFDHVRRNYGRKVAVDGLSLEVPRGQIFAFLGPNGAGKTTSIKMLVGLLRPSSGEVRVGGFNVAARPREAAHLMGYVPDEPYLYEKLTGREFLEFITEMHGMDRQEAGLRIARQVECFELADFIDDLTECYSHGMKQRLVFAAALLHDPRALVLDEPMVGLDPRSTRLVKDLLRERAAAGTAVFMSTHSLDLAEEIAGRIGIVDHGRLLCAGTLSELRAQTELDHTSLERLFLDITAGRHGGNDEGRMSNVERMTNIE